MRFIKALVALTLWLSACPARVDDADGDDTEGLGDPCSHTDTVDALCLGGVICVELTPGAGGVCAAIPSSCAALPDHCDCADLATLCDGALPDLCFQSGERLSVICRQ